MKVSCVSINWTCYWNSWKTCPQGSWRSSKKFKCIL